MELYVINPETGRRILYKRNYKGSKTTYQKLEEAGKLRFADVVIQNLTLPYDIHSGLQLTGLLARSNAPVFTTNLSDKVVKIGDATRTGLITEYSIRKQLPDGIAPRFYEYGVITDLPLNYIVMDKLDYTLASKKEALSDTDFAHLVKDICSIYSKLVPLKLAYNDLKPENIMYSLKERKWLLVDLESFTSYGTQMAPHHTITYTPTSFIVKDPYTSVLVDSYTEAENIAYCLYDILSPLPWSRATQEQEVLELRKIYALEEVPIYYPQQRFALWLYLGSQERGVGPLDFTAIGRLYPTIISS